MSHPAFNPARHTYGKSNLELGPALPTDTPPSCGTRPAVCDGRTGAEWIKSAIAYCEWRSGNSWRHVLDREQRNSPDRWYYLDGAKTLTDILYGGTAQPTGLHVPLPVLNPAPVTTDQMRLDAGRPRAELVKELMHLDPTLTDAKILSGLQRNKLARMLADAREAAPAQARHTA